MTTPRPTKRSVHNLRTLNRKPYDKKMRRLSVQSKYKKPVSHELTSDSEVPQKIKRRRTQSYTVTSRSFRRKVTTPLSSASNTSTRAADKSDSSSDYDDDDEDRFGEGGNYSSNVKTPVVLDMNIPSTSTGITANGKGFLFRIANNNQNDSDDDQSIPDTNQHSNDNQLRVLRSPPIHNGSSNHRYETRPNGKKKHHHEEDSSSNLVEDYASSNSNSLLSSTEEDSQGSNDSQPCYTYGKRQKLFNVNNDENGNESNNNNSHGFNNNNSFNAVNNNFTNGAGGSTTTNSMFGTPGINRFKMTPDSGISRGSLYTSLATPSPSSSRGACSNDTIQSKLELIKRNIRKNIQTSDDDSD